MRPPPPSQPSPLRTGPSLAISAPPRPQKLHPRLASGHAGTRSSLAALSPNGSASASPYGRLMRRSLHTRRSRAPASAERLRWRLS